MDLILSLFQIFFLNFNIYRTKCIGNRDLIFLVTSCRELLSPSVPDLKLAVAEGEVTCWIRDYWRWGTEPLWRECVQIAGWFLEERSVLWREDSRVQQNSFSEQMFFHELYHCLTLRLSLKEIRTAYLQSNTPEIYSYAFLFFPLREIKCPNKNWCLNKRPHWSYHVSNTSCC